MEPSVAAGMARARRPVGPSLRHGPCGPLCSVYMDQAIRFLDFEGRRLAYSTYGEGPPIVFGPRWVSHLEEEWDDPRQRAFYAEVARTHTRDPLRPGRLRPLRPRELDPRPTVEAESRQLAAVIEHDRRARDRLRVVVLLPRRVATRRRAAGPDREDRLLRRLRVTRRHPGRDEALADRVHPDELDARRADARRALRPARERRRDRGVHAHAARRRVSGGRVDLPGARSRRRRPRRCCRTWPFPRSCCIAAAIARCRSVADASSPRCCRTRGSCRSPVTRTCPTATTSGS